MLAALVASALEGERHKVEDFMLARPPRPRPTWEQIRQALALSRVVSARGA